MTIAALLFGLSIGGAILSLGYYFRTLRSSIQKRLEDGTLACREAAPPREEPRGILPPALAAKFEKKLGLAKNSVKARDLQKMFKRAGIYHDQAVSILMALKLGLAVILPLVVMPFLIFRAIPRVTLLASFLVLVGFGYFLPTFVLRHMMDSRQKKIQKGLPDALDLLVVCVEAGQGLNAALKRVSDDFRLTNPPLAQEFAMVNLEMNAGLDREQALRNLAERTGVEEVASLCSILIQSDRFGTSMANALGIQSDTLRTTRRQKLEEKAAKTPVKLLFPLLLCIFPALLVVIMGPAAIKIMETIVKK